MKILPNKSFSEKLVLPLKLLMSDDIGTPNLPTDFHQLFWRFFSNTFFLDVLEG